MHPTLGFYLPIRFTVGLNFMGAIGSLLSAHPYIYESLLSIRLYFYERGKKSFVD
jgi:hypothetical protein